MVLAGLLPRAKQYYFGLGWPAPQTKVILLESWLACSPDQSNITLVLASPHLTLGTPRATLGPKCLCGSLCGSVSQACLWKSCPCLPSIVSGPGPRSMGPSATAAATAATAVAAAAEAAHRSKFLRTSQCFCTSPVSTRCSFQVFVTRKRVKIVCGSPCCTLF